MLNKSVKLTENQYKAARMLVNVADDLLDQASPTDETPLEITLAEALEVFGKKLMGNL